MTAQEFIARVFKECREFLPVPVVRPHGYKVSEHLKVGVDKLASPDTGEVLEFPPMTALYEEARKIHGRPIPVTAGYRTLAHEHELQAHGYKTAKWVSPHCFGAMDLDARVQPDRSEVAENAAIRHSIIKAAENLGLPRPRLGWQAYANKFTHVDMVFLLFAPYTSVPHPCSPGLSMWNDIPEAAKKTLEGWRPAVDW